MLPRPIIIRTKEEAAAVQDAIKRSKENGRAAAFAKQAASKAPIIRNMRARSSEDEQVAFNHLAEGSNPSGPTKEDNTCPECKAKSSLLLWQGFNSICLVCYKCGYRTEPIVAVDALLELYRLRNLVSGIK